MKGRRKMKKLFISQPMRGKSKEEILETRLEVIKMAEKLTKETFEIIDSYMAEASTTKAHPSLWYLGESLKFLSDADIAVFAPGWKEARGCRIEHNCAEAYNIPILELD